MKWKKRWNKCEKEIVKNTKIIFFLAMIFCIIYGARLYYIGFHNVDLTVNMIATEHDMDKEGDVTNKGFVTYRELLSTGYDQMNEASLILLIGGFFMGLLVREL